MPVKLGTKFTSMLHATSTQVFWNSESTQTGWLTISNIQSSHSDFSDQAPRRMVLSTSMGPCDLTLALTLTSTRTRTLTHITNPYSRVIYLTWPKIRYDWFLTSWLSQESYPSPLTSHGFRRTAPPPIAKTKCPEYLPLYVSTVVL